MQNYNKVYYAFIDLLSATYYNLMSFSMDLRKYSGTIFLQRYTAASC